MTLTSVNSPIKLNNGVEIPCVGYGTFRTDPAVTAQAVQDAIAAGYRHIDTAKVYENEVGVGQGIKAAGVPREELFVTSKLWNTDRGYEATKAAFQASLDRLGLDYLDLYLIHWPANEKQFGADAAKINAETWRAMEELYEAGKIRAIGLSNFMPHHVAELLKTAKIKPMVDQIEVHPGWTHAEEIKKLQAMDIVVEAWGPLGGQGATVLVDPTMQKIAAAHGKSTAQVSLRWILQQGVVPLPKSVHVDRLKQNMELFDFELSNEEMQTIAALPNLGGQCKDPDDVDF
ncbi:aldo/keto reductase [Limosilactobacillus ingluviei]|uniref:aldo/keto reductase n=1 Tax=Limosilactobacillus ingluviei TaxID=148604 RepID=UPI00195D1CF4|nr:aldo/keto reductase [Limosilactobacillus ingluviei]MBM6727803.1 aldo/keto reductase [Limosilactobacillus ingluviei]MDO4603217.1 aldo/keto reductase [Limosilactobacillus ingluviei]